MKSTQQHFAIRGDDGIKRIWYTKGLWERARSLDIRTISIDGIPAVDMNTWFFGQEPTCRRVAEHAKRMNDAAFDFPIILSADGWVMDGMHRVCKAIMLGKPTIEAVQFSTNPPPDVCAASDDLENGDSMAPG